MRYRDLRDVPGDRRRAASQRGGPSDGGTNDDRTLEGLTARHRMTEREVNDLKKRWPDALPKLNDNVDVDVVTTEPTDGQALVFDADTGLWVPGTVGGSSAAEAFRFTSFENFDVDGFAIWDNQSFKSSGVTLSNADTRIDLPFGLWHINLRVAVGHLGTPPTSGITKLLAQSTGGGGSIEITWRDIAEATFARRTLAFDFLDVTAPAPFVQVDLQTNTLDQAVEHDIDISGHLVAAMLA